MAFGEALMVGGITMAEVQTEDHVEDMKPDSRARTTLFITIILTGIT